MKLIQIPRLAPPAPVGLPIDWVSVDSYYTNPSTTDDQAWAAAIATGANVYFPGGTVYNPRIYKIYNSYAPTAGQHLKFNCAFREDESALSQATETFAPVTGTTGYVLFRGTTNWLFQQAASWSIIEGCHVYQDPLYTPTTCGHFRQGGGVSIPYNSSTFNTFFANLSANFTAWQTCINGAAYEPQLINCKAQNAYIGLQLDGAVIQSNVEEVQCSNSILANIHIDTIAPFGDLHWNKVMSGWGYRTTYGLYVRGLDTSVINNLCLKGGKRFIYLAADNAFIANLNIQVTNFENCVNGDTSAGGSAGADIITFGGNANAVTNCKIGGMWCAAPGLIRFASNTAGCAIIGGNLSSCGIIDLGTNNRIMENNFDGAGALTAIDLRGANGIVSGNVTNSYVLGLNLAAGAGAYAVTGNTFANNTTVSTLNPTAKALGRGSANIGITDW